MGASVDYRQRQFRLFRDRGHLLRGLYEPVKPHQKQLHRSQWTQPAQEWPLSLDS